MARLRLVTTAGAIHRTDHPRLRRTSRACDDLYVHIADKALWTRTRDRAECPSWLTSPTFILARPLTWDSGRKSALKSKNLVRMSWLYPAILLTILFRLNF